MKSQYQFLGEGLCSPINIGMNFRIIALPISEQTILKTTITKLNANSIIILLFFSNADIGPNLV